MMNIRQMLPLSLILVGGCVLPPEIKEVKSSLTYVFRDDEPKNEQDRATSTDESKRVEKTTALKDDSEQAPLTLPLDAVAAKVNKEDLTSLYEVSPSAASSTEKSNVVAAPKAYKVIKVGEEEIRVLDKNMGAVEGQALEELRSQPKH